MIIGAIIVGILILGLIILWSYCSKNSCSFDEGACLGVVISILVVIEISLAANIMEEPTPSALDVYRGNTELEITSVNGVPTDTVVVFKNK